MDQEMCLELMKIGSSDPKPNTKPYKFTTPLHSPIRAKQKFSLPDHPRPKSAFISCSKANVSKLLYYKKPMRNNIEIRPWSKSSTPTSSRPSSSLTYKKAKTKSSVKINLVVPVPAETISNSSNDLQTRYSLNKFEENTIVQNSAIEEYISLNPKEPCIFSTEVPGFVHDNFPASKVKRNFARKAHAVVSGEFPKREEENKRITPIKPCYFMLKRRYHPIKCKVNYVPRYLSSPYRPKKLNIKK